MLIDYGYGISVKGISNTLLYGIFRLSYDGQYGNSVSEAADIACHVNLPILDCWQHATLLRQM